MDPNKILLARESKINLIKTYIDKYQVVSLKANIPGPSKSLYYAYTLINIYNNLYISKLNPIKTIFIDSDDGPYYIYLFNKDYILKDKLVEIENTTLGRFIDLDCYYNNFISMHRSSPRKCYLCLKDAFVCNKENNHSLKEKLDYIEENIKNHLCDDISALIKSSILEELDLTIKFGLISPISNGSHKDMNYSIMKDSIDSFRPYLVDMFKEGLESNSDLINLFYKVKNIGIKADESMFNKTNNINTYQGLIFNLGLILTSLGYCIKHHKSIDDLYANCSKMVSNIDKNFGAIKEAKDGYRSIKNIVDKYELDSTLSKRLALIDLIINVEDTIFIKRCSSELERIKLKNKFKEALINKDNQLINQINEYCETNNYSFGGCADLLIVSIFIKKILYLFNIDY